MGRLTASIPEILNRPDLDDTRGGHGWIVTVYDNDTNTVEQVVSILLIATGCSLEEAEIETWEIHHLGRSVVHHGSQKVCEDVAEIVRQIGIRVTVTEE